MLKRDKIVVLKIGTNVINDDPGRTPAEVHLALAREIRAACDLGWKVPVVTSGAMAVGRKITGFKGKETIGQKQWLSTIGQPELYNSWRQALLTFNITTGQVLLTHRELENQARRVCISRLLHTHLEAGTIPIINENDAVEDDEIRALEESFSDNDDLAHRVAILLGATAILFVTKNGGVFTRNSEGVLNGGLYAEIAYNARLQDLGLTDTERDHADTRGGRGGIVKKIKYAQACYREKIRNVGIGNLVPGVLPSFLVGGNPGTRIALTNRIIHRVAKKS